MQHILIELLSIFHESLLIYLFSTCKKQQQCYMYKELRKKTCKGNPENPQGAWHVGFPKIIQRKLADRK